MTQLPEVEVLRRDLEKEVVGKRIKQVLVTDDDAVRRHGGSAEFVDALQGRKIEAVERKGVTLVFPLDAEAALVLRLGASTTVSRETATEEPGEHTRVVATFTTGGALHYADPDGDGELFVITDAERGAVDDLAPSGIDPLAQTFTWLSLGQRLRQRDTLLKPLLVDESFVVGLGDLYSDEILWTAGLSGERSSAGLTSQEVRRLYRAVLEVLFEAVKRGGVAPDGTGDDDEDDANEQLKVFGKQGRPCQRCRQPIRHGQLAGGHPSYYCANCQT